MADDPLSDNERGHRWVRDYPEVAYPLVNFDRAKSLAYINRHYHYANPPVNASEAFFEGADEEALRVDILED